LDEAVRTHPFIASVDGRHEHNSRYEDPAAFVRNRTCGYVDPLEILPAAVELFDPTLGSARHSAVELATAAGLEAGLVEGLSVAVTEVVANAQAHGARPLRVRMWSNSERVVVAVTDQGEGIRDLTAGLMSIAPGAERGRGLWITNQLCSQVAMEYGEEGFTVRLVVGPPSAV
jgi:anti-sigma regulatory factor (Ser/Thr protein kinase)